jgi:hypothetical protein
MENGGNARVNAIFEPHLPNPNLKPHNHADGPTRERFIRDKYERRKFYDPNGFTSAIAIQTTAPRKANSPVPTRENDGDRMPSRRSESVGPPSDAARQRLEERRQRIKHSNSTLDKPSNGVGIFPASSSKDKTKKSVNKAPMSAPSPSIDLLDFGTETVGSSQTINQNDLFNTKKFGYEFSVCAPELSSRGSEVADQATQPKAGGLDMFEFLTKDMSKSQPQPTHANNPYGGDILSLYNNNHPSHQRSSFGSGVGNDPAFNASMPSLVSYTSGSAGNGLADSFTNLAINGSNPSSMGVMQQQNQLMYPQQPSMNNAMPMNHSMMNNPMMNKSIMNNPMMNNPMMNNTMMNNPVMMQNSNGMMMQGVNPMYTQGSPNNMMLQGGMMNGNSPMYQQNSFQMPGYSAGQTNYSNSMGVGNQVGRGQTNYSGGYGMPGQGGETKVKNQQVMEKDDPFAQFGMNVFRS